VAFNSKRFIKLHNSTSKPQNHTAVTNHTVPTSCRSASNPSLTARVASRSSSSAMVELRP
jgi:hypothetical protein